MNSEGTDAPDYGVLTQRFISSKQWDRALSAAREWLGKEPENVRAHRAAAQSLVNLERHAEARTHLEKVLAGKPNDGFAHRLMSMVHFQEKRFKQADESIQRAIAIDPQDAFHWHHLARMSYQQGDSVTARKSAEKARELNPRDPDILNLVILCEPNSPDMVPRKIRRYEEALALDPENAYLHNNIGVQYLALKDQAKAEECFRRALFFNPSVKLFQRNLLITVKQRDAFYRALCAPKDMLFKLLGGFARVGRRNILLYLLMIPVWLIAFRFILTGLALWFTLVWPLTKVYEYLTIGDIRAQAGELGARRGGLFGYRKWSVNVRLSLFAVILVLFWGGLVFAVMNNAGLPSRDDAVVLYVVLFAIIIFLLAAAWLRAKLKQRVRAAAARKRARRFENILHPGLKKRRWWQIFRRHT
ncbi:MAG: tetratricopeptide repeat protein [Verrucomicrobiae bacterium]|nr:tetratricopeptide repeat protein [Verrucomicrobiae bacterium]